MMKSWDVIRLIIFLAPYATLIPIITINFVAKQIRRMGEDDYFVGLLDHVHALLDVQRRKDFEISVVVYTSRRRS